MGAIIMELNEAIQARRSIRKFKTDEISEEQITELIKAGIAAPSGTNVQPTRYVVIKSAEARAKLKDCTSLPFVYKAPVVLACCIDTEAIKFTEERINKLREAKAFVDTPLNDVDNDLNAKKKEYNAPSSAAIQAYLSLNAAIAIDHITLRAVELGLGTCWVMMFDKEKTKALLELEDNYEVVALLPVGYPDQSPEQRPRLSYEEVLLKEV